jgi:hypothetical protein
MRGDTVTFLLIGYREIKEAFFNIWLDFSWNISLHIEIIACNLQIIKVFFEKIKKEEEGSAIGLIPFVIWGLWC